MKTTLLIRLMVAVMGLCWGSFAAWATVREHPYIDHYGQGYMTVDSIRFGIGEDSAPLPTELRLKIDFSPRRKFLFPKRVALQAGGQTYLPLRVEGLAPGDTILMPESGQISALLTFPPLPADVQSVDLVDLDYREPLFWGLDLTGTRHFEPWPAALPEEFRHCSEDASVPDPIFACGATQVRLHLLNYHPSLSPHVDLTLYQPYADFDTKNITVDSLGEAQFTIQTYGTVSASIVYDFMPWGDFWLAPNETVDLYIDLRQTGMLQNLPDKQARKHCAYVHVTGTYRDLTEVFNRERQRLSSWHLLSIQKSGMDLAWGREAYMNHWLNRYDTDLKKIETDTTSSRMVRELKTLAIQQNLVSVVVYYQNMYKRLTQYQQRKLGANAQLPAMTCRLEDADYRAVVERVDLNDPKLYLAMQAEYYRMSQISEDWAKYGVTGTRAHAMYRLRRMSRAASNGSLSADEMAELRSYGPYYAEVATRLNRDTKALTENQGQCIQPLPDVPVDSLWAAILKPYRGKVVVVDFWNTWCVPCVHAMVEHEALKDSTLSSPDIVWLYIADESSPLGAYLKRIPTVRGLHYRVNSVQAQALKQPFGIKSVPSYVLVDRAGNATLRPDFFDTDVYIRKILQEVNQTSAIP
jgi:thiol-disulfide isomerase/thioredoxin